ncbi:hypothetical protein IKF20_00965 [Candidatus Saccharibacteria bacterium]|nr:hypothetical protein [Candidatus Saccharibacteria bacterium]
MEGTDINRYADTSNLNDHSYYGNGCPNVWDSSAGAPYYGGSLVSCSTRIIETYQREVQKIGTYLNFQAATSGTGGAAYAPNIPVPDSFCPLGWQLPYDGTGGDYYDKSKSVNYLFNLYSFDRLSYNNIMSYPFDYVLSGHLWIQPGALYRQGNVGTYMADGISNGAAIRTMFLSAVGVTYQSELGKAFMSPVRCIDTFENLSSTAR